MLKNSDEDALRSCFYYTGVEVGERALYYVRTVREFCTDFDTTCWANCSCSSLDVHPTSTPFACHSVGASPDFYRVRMAVDQHQSLAWMLVHHQVKKSCDSSKHVFRQRLSATLFSHAFQPRLPATSFSHAFRPRLPTCQMEDVMLLGRTGCTTDFSAQ